MVIARYKTKAEAVRVARRTFNTEAKRFVSGRKNWFMVRVGGKRSEK